MKGVCFFMKKRFIAVLIMILPAFLMATQARNIEILDVPTANTLMKGEIRGDFKFYPGGGILSRLYVGIFDRLMIGGAERLDNIISSADISAHIPWFLAKVRITDDDDRLVVVGQVRESHARHASRHRIRLCRRPEIACSAQGWPGSPDWRSRSPLDPCRHPQGRLK